MSGDTVTQLVTLLAWLALPVGALVVVDDWFLRPRRRLAVYPQVAAESGFMRLMYLIFPILIVAVVVKLLRAERLDFSLVLVLVAAVSGVIYAIDAFGLRRVRNAQALQYGKDPSVVQEPAVVDYARSFFPVALVVLVLRSFIFEPFRIPSDSMMPTLLDGDFIVVNKFSYGLRLPVLNTRFVDIGAPQRGDVVVFRYPPDPAVNYIKRLVGLPGDRVRVESDRLYVNGEQVSFTPQGRYNDGCYQNMRIAEEQLGEHKHRALYCLTTGSLVAPPLASCPRRLERSYACDDDAQPDPMPAGNDSNDTLDKEVPEGFYLMIGDNRDNSADSRVWGLVPEANLVGKAQRIWFNWDLQRSGGPLWSRIGARID